MKMLAALLLSYVASSEAQFCQGRLRGKTLF